MKAPLAFGAAGAILPHRRAASFLLPKPRAKIDRSAAVVAVAASGEGWYPEGWAPREGFENGGAGYGGPGGYYEGPPPDQPPGYAWQNPGDGYKYQGAIGDFEDRRRDEYGRQSDFDRWPQDTLGWQDQYQYQGGFQGGNFDDGRQENYYDESRSPFGPEGYYQGGYGRPSVGNEYEGGYYNNERPSRQQFDIDDQNSGADRYASQMQGYGSSRSQALQRREQAQQQQEESIRGEPLGFGILDRMMDRMDDMMNPFGNPFMNPFMGFRMMDRMMDEMLGPFPGFGMMDRMMDEFGTGMQALRLDQDSVEGLLEEARGYLLDDPAVSEMLGDDISLGNPFARSSSSAMVNGVSRSRLQLGIPIRGSKGTGRVKLVAEGGGIIQLDLDANGQIVGIPVGTGRISNSRPGGGDDVIDADVIDANVEY